MRCRPRPCLVTKETKANQLATIAFYECLHGHIELLPRGATRNGLRVAVGPISESLPTAAAGSLESKGTKEQPQTTNSAGSGAHEPRRQRDDTDHGPAPPSRSRFRASDLLSRGSRRFAWHRERIGLRNGKRRLAARPASGPTAHPRSPWGTRGTPRVLQHGLDFGRAERAVQLIGYCPVPLVPIHAAIPRRCQWTVTR